MNNPLQLLQLKSQWDKFEKNHPKFRSFMNAAASQGIEEGTIIEVTITDPSGKSICSNIMITESDMELIRTMQGLAKQ